MGATGWRIFENSQVGLDQSMSLMAPSHTLGLTFSTCPLLSLALYSSQQEEMVLFISEPGGPYSCSNPGPIPCPRSGGSRCVLGSLSPFHLKLLTLTVSGCAYLELRLITTECPES